MLRLTRRAFGFGALSTAGAASAQAQSRRLKLLVLGGTYYLGPATVEAAVQAGHKVTLFNRGQTNPKLFPQLELIRGDRDAKSENLAGLAGDRRWDAVIDVWPADAAMSQRSAELLKDRVGRYIYVSSISAYSRLTIAGATENYPLVATSPDPTEYGFAKAETERRLQAIFGSRFASVRPPPILGWRNDSDVLTFWAVRMARGGDVVAVGDAEDTAQFTDVKDIGAWLVQIAERNLEGPFNVVGPAQRLSYPAFLEQIRDATGDRANLVWLPYDFLVAQGVTQFSVDLPLYRPHQWTTRPGFTQVSSARALAAGIRFRSLQRTVADELRWFPIYRGANFEFGGVGQPADAPYWLRMGLSRTREAALLAAWKARQA